MEDAAPPRSFRLSGHRLSRFLLVEACLATVLGVMTTTMAVGNSTAAERASQIGAGSLYLLCAIVLSWGAGLYHNPVPEEEAPYQEEFRRDGRLSWTPAPLHIDVPWTANDILFGMTGALIALNLFAAVADVLLGAIGLQTNAATRAQQAVASTISDVFAYVGMLASVVAFAVLRRGAGLRQLGWRPPLSRDWFYFTPLIGSGVILGDVILLRLGEVFAPAGSSAATQCAAIRGSFGPFAALALLITAVAAPVFEETVFRGFLYGYLRGRIGWVGGAVLSGLIFALFHVNAVLILPLWFLGVVLAIVYEKSRSLFPGMVVHSLFNLAGTLSILLSHGC